MKRRNAAVLGNILMGFGLVTMISGVGYTILNQMPNLGLPQNLAHAAVMGIFLGAILWLAGARVGGRECVADRYWWVRHYDHRCRKDHRHS